MIQPMFFARESHELLMNTVDAKPWTTLLGTPSPLPMEARADGGSGDLKEPKHGTPGNPETSFVKAVTFVFTKHDPEEHRAAARKIGPYLGSSLPPAWEGHGSEISDIDFTSASLLFFHFSLTAEKKKLQPVDLGHVRSGNIPFGDRLQFVSFTDLPWHCERALSPLQVKRSRCCSARRKPEVFHVLGPNGGAPCFAKEEHLFG